MKLLFLGFHYLGPLYPLAQWLAERGHEVLYAFSRSPNLQKPLSGPIQRVILKRFTPPAKNGAILDSLENALAAARSAEKSLLVIRESGFLPDMVFSASSGGAALAIPSVFPEACWLNFVEPSFQTESREQIIQNLQLCMARKTYVFYPSQKLFFPESLRLAIKIFQPVVNCGWFTPGKERPGPGFAAFFNIRHGRILSEFLEASPDNRAIWIAPSGQAKKSFQEGHQDFSEDRCQICLNPDPEEIRTIFRTARLCFFEFPGEMTLQAMACGCACFAANGLAKEDLPQGLRQIPASGKILSDLLKDGRLLDEYASICRQIAVSHFDVDALLPAWFKRVCEKAAER